LLKILGSLLGKSIEPDLQPARVGDVRDSLADISLARKLLGYEPQVRLEEGIKRTIAYYRSIVGEFAH
jgi:UDP-glucose 4-epimerase